MTIFLYVWLALVFVLGAMIGSFLNVCIHRLPFEKSVFWPLGSRCGNCYRPIRWYDNLPLLSYWLLRGRCRTCGAPFSARYFVIELLTGLAFVGIFYAEIILNIHELPAFDPRNRFGINLGLIPLDAWIYFGYHALLLSFLIVVSCTDLEHSDIPISVAITGMLVGLIGATLWPWPWPNAQFGGPPANPGLKLGLLPWPVWHPLPAWLPAGSWREGLATGLAGALAGSFLPRTIRFVFGLGRGKEGMGLGDADILMMAGSFLGWQPLVVAFFVAVLPGLFFGILQLILRGNQAFPYGPSLAMGIVITWLSWHWIGPRVQLFFFDGTLMLILGATICFLLLVISFVFRLLFP